MSLSRSFSGGAKPSKAVVSDETISEPGFTQFAEIKTMDDVIANFFNQIVQYVIEDMIVFEKEPENSESLVKDSSEIVDKSKSLVKDKSEIVDKSKGLVRERSEIVDKSKSLVKETSSEIGDSSKSLVKDRSEVVEKSKSVIEQTLVKDYKELKTDDLVDAQVTAASGSKVVLTKRTPSSRSKSGKFGSSTFASNLDVIKEHILEKSKSRTSTADSASVQEPQMEKELEAKIIFINGNVYEGTISKRIMNGKGRYIWADGTVYEGDFKDGFPTGKGEMTLPDLSHFEGDFNQGLFHGHGFLNIVSTPTFYCGEWQNGQKHGQGWLLYEPGDWYEGGWAYNLKDGFGVRVYKNGAKYHGWWREGKYDSNGTLIWENNDYYDGEWQKGLMHGQGEYIWGAFYNEAFAFPPQTIYRGSWEKGRRCGFGIMHFGDNTGLRFQGDWDQDFKHGDGLLICGNGRVVQQNSLFQYDKPKTKTYHSRHSSFLNTSQILEVPIFTAPEFLDVGFYVDKILAKLVDTSEDKLNTLKHYEEKCIRYLIIRNLPKLKDLYKDYASMAAKIKLDYEPIMMRLFLWQMYKDMGLSKRGVSLARTDEILAENPKSCLVSLHDPFEPIYFWQFLMSIIGTALTIGSLEESDESGGVNGGVSAVIVQKFLDEIIFSRAPDHQSTILMNYLDLAPIKAVYELYKKIGEPHTARTFLRHSCSKKGESPLSCHLELRMQKAKPLFGVNLVPINEHITFVKEKIADFDESVKHHWTNLFDFRHLGPRNIMRCIATACPLVMSENLVVNVDYPLTFLEFYETLLTCIFMVLELEMKKEQKILSESITPVATIQSITSTPKVVKTNESKKKIQKAEKKAKKKKKKHA